MQWINLSHVTCLTCMSAYAQNWVQIHNLSDRYSHNFLFHLYTNGWERTADKDKKCLWYEFALRYKTIIKFDIVLHFLHRVACKSCESGCFRVWWLTDCTCSKRTMCTGLGGQAETVSHGEESTWITGGDRDGERKELNYSMRCVFIPE